MQRGLIIVLVFAILLVIFALQNAGSVVVKIYFWSKEIPLSLLLVLVFFLGAITGIVYSIGFINKKNHEITRLKKYIEKTTDEKTTVEFKDDM